MTDFTPVDEEQFLLIGCYIKVIEDLKLGIHYDHEYEEDYINSTLNMLINIKDHIINDLKCIQDMKIKYKTEEEEKRKNRQKTEKEIEALEYIKKTKELLNKLDG